MFTNYSYFKPLIYETTQDKRTKFPGRQMSVPGGDFVLSHSKHIDERGGMRYTIVRQR